MGKYKVGDRVRVKTDLVAREKYDGLYFNADMCEFTGKEYTIKKALSNGYYILDVHNDWWFNDAMLEYVDKKAELKTVMLALKDWAIKYEERLVDIRFLETADEFLICGTTDARGERYIVVQEITPKPKKMTKAEIEQALGHPVEITE